MHLPIVFLLLAQASPPPQSSISIIPRPVQVAERAGHFTITARTPVWADAASAAVAEQFARDLAGPTGFALRVRIGGAIPARAIAFHRDRGLAKRLGGEGYVLDVRPTRIVIRAAAPAGLFYATQTIRQMLPPEVFRSAPVGSTAWTVPAAAIEDYPRFAWRGAHLDTGRHFMPKEFVEKYIDLIAMHKLNTFHWHLTEDQGWRIEIKRYPRLTTVGAWRKETLVGRSRGPGATYDGQPHGGFYTQEDAREVVAYAKARFVTVVPEIEMPGHAMAAIAAYPEIGVTGEPVEVATRWGVFSDILNAEPSTIQFMQNVLTEVLAIFPSCYIHVGGDEADKTKWKASPRIQARIRALGLADEHELQSWFIRQMDAFLTSKGRRLVGWDEILEGGLADNAVVMSWRGTKGGIDAARSGHDVVMAPSGNTYLDYAQSADLTDEPVGQTAVLPLEKVYAYDPIPDELEPAFARHVLGAQAQVWTEYMPTPKSVEYMAFPRLTALAEVVWTPKARKDYPDYLQRLDADLERLRARDVNFRGAFPRRPPQEPLANR